MAKFDDESLGLRGLINGMVYRKTKFGVTVSSYDGDVYRKKEWTPKQALARNKFRVLTTLARVFKEACDVGFGREMKHASSPCFVKHNYSVVEIKGKDAFDVDGGRLCFSKGVLPVLSDARCRVEGRDVAFEWTCEEGIGRSCTDSVVAVAYCREALRSDGLVAVGDGMVWMKMARRTDCRMTVVLPERWNGMKVLFYLFVVNEEGRTSDTQAVNAAE